MPFSSLPTIVTSNARSTGTVIPWIDRQPSSATSVSSLRSTISGLTTAATSSSSRWKTKTRRSDADLGRREADAVRVDHQQLHPLDEASQLVVELDDRARLHPERGVGVLADLGERDPPARRALGVELLVDDLPFDVLVVLVVLFHAVGTLPRRWIRERRRRS